MHHLLYIKLGMRTFEVSPITERNNCDFMIISLHLLDKKGFCRKWHARLFRTCAESPSRDFGSIIFRYLWLLAPLSLTPNIAEVKLNIEHNHHSNVLCIWHRDQNVYFKVLPQRLVLPFEIQDYFCNQSCNIFLTTYFSTFYM